ncbi:MAG TPA: hypothetical protein V6D13_01060 [Halomicronema sp.]
MSEAFSRIFKNFISDSIEDQNQDITLIKLLSGIIFGFLSITIAFTIATNGQQIMQEIFSFKFTNDVIYLLIGAFILIFTLTKIGTKKSNSD